MKIKNLSSNNIQRICEYINSLASVFEKYNPSSTYYIDDYVIYDDKLYKCISNIDSPEEFDSSKWEMILEGKAGKDAPSISKLYCKDKDLYVDFDNKTTKKIENFNFNIDTVGTSDMEDTPVGQIISYMGTKAPAHYLICDGSIYNISDYQKLADSFKEQFGSYNYFGGDGITTFAVPDLRNEFIRGYHGESDEKLSGDIGKHQDATIIQNPIATNSSNNFLYTPIPNDVQKLIVENKNNSDTAITETNNGINKYSTSFEAQTATVVTSYTTRPTNVSVLFCIKYENTYYAKITNINTYKETILYKNSIPIASTLDNLDTTKYATTDSPMELTLDEDLSKYDRLEIILGVVTYSGNNYWIPINDKVDGKGNGNIYYRNCLMVTNNSYCSVQLDYIYADKKIILRNYGMSTSDMKGATILSVIGIKYVSSNIDVSETYTDEEVNTTIDNVLNSYDGTTDNAVYTDSEVNTEIDNVLNSYDGAIDNAVYTDNEVDNAIISIIDKY